MSFFSTTYDIVIVGGGISGLFLAELIKLSPFPKPISSIIYLLESKILFKYFFCIKYLFPSFKANSPDFDNFLPFLLPKNIGFSLKL